MPVNVWHETLDIKQHIVLDHNIDIQTEEGLAEFEAIKPKVTEVLKKSMFYISDEEFAALDKESSSYKPVWQLRTIIKYLEEAPTPEKYSTDLDLLYFWADENRVWLGM
ncbi:hypothetical protein [Streptomyces atratus]|uniref:hypothetical protein n=1 Tax=Streptomyces atratus TaxID=1893 RepID=UPI0036535F68